MSYNVAFSTPIPLTRFSRPAILSALSGRWTGTLIANVGVPPVRFLIEGDGDPAFLGRFPFAALDIPPADVTLLDANDRRYVALVGPYREGVEDMMTLVEGRRHGTGISGVFYSFPVKGGVATARGSFYAERAGKY